MFADCTEYHIHRVTSGVMIRLPIRNGVSGLSNNQDSRISNGADTTNQIITLAMARKRHDRTGLLDGCCPVDRCDPAVDALVSVVVGLMLFNGAAEEKTTAECTRVQQHWAAVICDVLINCNVQMQFQLLLCSASEIAFTRRLISATAASNHKGTGPAASEPIAPVPENDRLMSVLNLIASSCCKLSIGRANS